MAVVTETARRPALRLGEPGIALALAAAATLLTLFLNADAIRATMNGGFGDPDDAMRLVEVRNWLAGQAWFDMNAARLDPPNGSVLHWSRLVDLPMAAMIRLFGLFTSAPTAERLAAATVPTLWLLALYIGVIRLATVLAGPAGRLPAVLGMFLGGATLVQFIPGRIGHHAPETVALVCAVGTAVAALDARHARQTFFCGALIALSLAMSLETLPFLVVLIGLVIGFWTWDGAGYARMLGWFAAGLLVSLPLFFLLTAAPDRWQAATCDAYSAAHLVAGVVGAIGMLLLAGMTSRLPGRLNRLVAVALLGTAALVTLTAAFPACLHSPFARVDAVVRTLWLDHVVESLGLLAFMKTRPLLGIAILAPVALGIAGSIAAAATRRGVEARRFLLVGTLSATGLALAFWQVRVIGSITPIALCGGIFVAARLADRTILAPVAILPFCSTVWLLALPADATTPAAAEANAAKTACLSPGALAPLAALPPGAAVAPIDSGSHLLQWTPLAVFAAPYHRNDDGNRFAFEVFLAKPEVAAARLAERHVAYVITCPGMSEQLRLAARAPDGLAAQLAAGKVPPFLQRQGLPGTPYQVFRVLNGK